MQQTNSGISRSIEDWRGQEIAQFQEDLQHKINEYISEKWFYNHFKTYGNKLPRIDLLNILSRYIGYIDWSEFKHKNSGHVSASIIPRDSNKVFYLLPVIALIIFIIAWVIIKTGSVATYRFCFVDKDSKEPISGEGIEVAVLYDNESPLQQKCNPEGCFTYKTGQQKIKFLVKAPYYFPDTITRILNKHRKNEEIQLTVNNYAMMIFYISNSKVNDWKRRREQLEKIIADSAFIYQVHHKGMMGMELYNKMEFIDMLTMPAAGLKHFEIIDMLYKDEKITSLRFTQDY